MLKERPDAVAKCVAADSGTTRVTLAHTLQFAGLAAPGSRNTPFSSIVKRAIERDVSGTSAPEPKTSWSGDRDLVVVAHASVCLTPSVFGGVHAVAPGPRDVMALTSWTFERNLGAAKPDDALRGGHRLDAWVMRRDGLPADTDTVNTLDVPWDAPWACGLMAGRLWRAGYALHNPSTSLRTARCIEAEGTVWRDVGDDGATADAPVSAEASTQTDVYALVPARSLYTLDNMPKPQPKPAPDLSKTVARPMGR
jgi:hypothetical protein